MIENLIFNKNTMKIINIDLNILDKTNKPNTYFLEISEEYLPLFQKVFMKWVDDDTFVQFNINK